MSPLALQSAGHRVAILAPDIHTARDLRAGRAQASAAFIQEDDDVPVYRRSQLLVVPRLPYRNALAWSWGGLTSLWNLVSLCPHCNRVKSNYWTVRGRVYYRAWEGADDIAAAHAILMAGLAAQRSPARLARLAWAHWLG